MKRANLFLLILISAIGAVEAKSEPELFEPGEVAFDGYDLVSYFTNDLKKGRPAFTTEYKGVKLQFHSEENLRKFLDFPSRYWPAYDGWCAISLVYDVLKKPDFSHYKIQNNKIYFFEVRAFFNGLTQWDKDPAKNEIIASVHYRNYAEGI